MLIRQTNRYLSPDHVYGYKPKNLEPWSAGNMNKIA